MVLVPGGTVTNGSTADTAALISGSRNGVYVLGGMASAVSNFGTITGAARNGVEIYEGPGSVTNGSTADTGALISAGGSGVYLGAGGTVGNFGTIVSGTYSAIHLEQGGIVTNGAVNDTAALIDTSSGSASSILVITGTSTITNFGTIEGNYAVNFNPGATGTVVNDGKIASTAGADGTAVLFGGGNNKLVVDPGASFVGSADAYNGTDTLELASGTGTLGGSIGNNAAFSGFITLQVDSGGIWTLDGGNTIANADNLGTLIIAAGGTLDVTGSVATTSTGTFEIGNGSTLSIAANTGTTDKIKFLGSSGDLVIDSTSNFGNGVIGTKYKGPLIENFAAGDTIDLTNIAYAGATLKYSKGLLQVTDGSTALATLSIQAPTASGTFTPHNDGSGHLLITYT